MQDPNAAPPPPEPLIPPEDEPLGDPTAGAADALLAEDPRVLQILSSEHSSLITQRSLAYNEAFERAGMFLTFLSMSFVAMALLAQALQFKRDFMVIASILIGFDFLIGIATYIRIVGTGVDDLHATQGMNRIRQGYVRIAPHVAPFFVTGTHDDLRGVFKTYGYADGGTALGDLAYGLSTALGMVGLIVAAIGGVFGAVVTLAFGGAGWLAFAVAAAMTLVVFALCARMTLQQVARSQAALEVLFPSPDSDSPA